MNRIILGAIIVVGILTRTAEGQPSWVKSKSSQNFPDRLYIIGVGFANKTSDRAGDLQKAYDAAFADIAKQIKSTVASQSSTQEYEVLSAAKSTLESQTSAEIKVSTEIKLGGLKVVDKYDDDDNNMIWSLAVLDRTSAADQLGETLRGFLGTYNKSVEMSRKDVANLQKSLLNMTDALKVGVQYNNLLPIYNFVAGPLMFADSAYRLPPAMLLSELKADAQSVLSGLRIQKVSGDTQSVSSKSSIEPLVVKVVSGQGKGAVPVTGVRVTFHFTNGNGKLSGRSTTDESGAARCDVFSLTPHSGNVYNIAVSLDLSELKISDKSAAEFTEWNTFLEKSESEASFTLKRVSGSLDDKLSDAILKSTSRIPDSSASISVSRIFYEDKIPGPMAEFLRQKIEQAIQSSTNLSIVSQEAVRSSQMQLSESGSLDNLSQPDYASHAAGAKYIVTGNYWKEGENLDLSLKVVNVSSHVLVGTAATNIPSEMLPKVSLAPENYNPVRDENIVKTERRGEDLKVEVWVDRIDGIYHEADTMSIYVRANQDCYVRLVYNDASGNAVLVFPNKVMWDSRVRGGMVYHVPGPFVVRPPFGREILKAYASDRQIPVPQGREINGLILLSSADDFQTAARGVGLSSGRYAENSLMLTTMPQQNYETVH